MKRIFNILILLFTGFAAYSQNTITGTFSGLKNQMVKLVGFKGFDTYTIDSVIVNNEGLYKLSYGENDYGMGYLAADDGKAFMVILGDDENLKLTGETLAVSGEVEIISGKQNKLFEQYASEHVRRERALSAWYYLENIYAFDSLFSGQQIPMQTILNEIQRNKTEDSLFLAGLNKNTYLSWYLPVHKLITSVSTIAQYHTDEIPATISAFRNTDYTDNRLYKSGLLKGIIDNHVWLIENSGYPLDSVYAEMEVSIDCIVENLSRDEQKLNEITQYLFKLLEKRSLFKASEYLSVKLLTGHSCTIDKDFSAILESYRAMKKGNTAPDIDFKGDVLAPGYEAGNIPQKLSDLKSNYMVVVFGASWCPHCPNVLMQIARVYSKWKKLGVEVVFVALDEDKEILNKFVSPFPFISFCDYQKWAGLAVKDYHVFATPEIYLLDNNRKILLRPGSVNQLDSWVDWFLVQGND